MENRLKKITDSGQTLLEVVIAIFIASILLGALAVATIVSLRNTQFSQNQNLATKQTQEALELLRVLKSRNDIEFNYRLDSGSYFQGSFDEFVKRNDICIDNPTNPNPCYIQISNTSSGPLLLRLNSTEYHQLDVNMQRTIKIVQLPTTGKRVTVTVSFTDPNGAHQSQIETDFY